LSLFWKASYKDSKKWEGDNFSALPVNGTHIHPLSRKMENMERKMEAEENV
jgi:hypothetical protein